MNYNFTQGYFKNLLVVFILSLLSTAAMAQSQLGIYKFDGLLGSVICPNPNNAVTTSAANVTFSNYINVGGSCVASQFNFDNSSWSTAATLDPTKYNQFTVTANAGMVVNLTSLVFSHVYGNPNPATWALRSSVDNYSTDLSTGSATNVLQTITVNLPAASFSNLAAVTFRLYLYNSINVKTWSNDDVTLNGTVVAAIPTPAAPTSNSPQCANPGVTLSATGSAPAGQTWYWQTSANGTATTNSAPTNTVTTSGTYYIRSQDNVTLAWSNAASISVVVTPNVTSPVFTLGATSSRCQSAGTVTYGATANNTTGIVYSLDGTCTAAGNMIDPNTGIVSYTAGWAGNAIITASASGCNGPVTSTHTATTNLPVGTPIFTLGASSTRCQGAGNVTYTATASNSNVLTYSLDATSLSNGNTINSSNGQVTYAAGWSGTSTITATATGCNPQSASHNVTITPTVGSPLFSAGPSSTRCQGASTVNYAATSTNNTGITYSLDAASITAGNTIISATGDVTYTSSWTGTSVITATANGCNGPRSSTHSAYTSAPVTAPVFGASNSSSRCQGSANVMYSATASNETSLSFALDAPTLAGGNSINSATGVVTYSSGWFGNSVITCTAVGCYGPLSTNYNVTTTASVGTPIFTSGVNSNRCQSGGVVNYSATATTTTGITYSLNASSISGGNTINSSTGDVTYSATYHGTTIITASAAGCNGPTVATHTAVTTATVGTPIFSRGASSTRCQGAGSLSYSASASTNTGITYTLDANSLTAGNSINQATGMVTYVAGWSGNAIITATATGCNGPSISMHTATTTPTVGVPTFALGTSSVRCQGGNNVTYTASATNTTGIWYDIDNASQQNSNNYIDQNTGVVSYDPNWYGTTTVYAYANGCNGPVSSAHTVTITPTVGNPSFALGASSNRCQAASTVNYSASATTNTSLVYSLDAASITAGNTINSSTGDVTYTAGWVGNSVITVTANGCNGPKTTTHTSSTAAPVTSPVFALGSSSIRCQGSNSVNYTATANNTTGITYALDAASIAGGNTINSNTGRVSYSGSWTGTSTITATAAGCYGPLSTIHTVTITPTVGTPIFAIGSTSVRCQGSGVVNYSATATTTTGITYTLDAGSISGGNSINSATGDVTYSASWSGTTIITARAAGCNGPSVAQHTVTVTATVATPIFGMGANSTRCQGAGTKLYSATATTNTGITYTLDALSIAGGNSINSASGLVTYVAGWFGSSTITATATGCNGPSVSSHVASTTQTVGVPVFALGSTSIRCQGAGPVTYSASATTTTGITYSLDGASIAGGNSINSASGVVTYAAGWSGTTTVTASAAGCNGPTVATHVVTITPTVGLPIFTLGSASNRCIAAGTVNYSATASTNTGITYSIDAASTSAGNSINPATGDVTYTAGWTGNTIITATASGCNGPRSSTHTATTNGPVATPVFSLGATSVRCQSSGPVTYTASAANNTGITYSLDSASITGGNTINSVNGVVNYTSGWTGTSIITASATGCYGPQTSTHTVTITPIVGVPVFSMGASSTRCQGGNQVTYTSSSTNTTGITYTLDATSLAAGNTINSNTGTVTYSATWFGSSTITASAAGCSGPRNATHTVTTTASVGTPVFGMGANSTRCQGAGTKLYSATATTNTGITYTLDALSIAGGNSINSASGLVTYVAGWFGSSTITATATGCNGPAVSSHVASTTQTVGVPVFALGSTSIRCQGAGPVTYSASATTTTGITYSLDGASIAGGNSINSASGVVTYAAGWSGTTTVTASAAGCNGPTVATHVVTITPTVGLPIFTLGSASSRCKAAGTVNYSATASTNTGITYSIDAASTSAGNSINPATGDVTYTAGWTGNTIITATASGCNGPRSSTHTATTNGPVATPVFSLGATSVRCQSSGPVTYTASAANNTGITYSLDSASITGGNTINSANGVVNYTSGWTGTSIITASATGCYGPQTSTHTVTITPIVGVPVFSMGASSTRCQGGNQVTYTSSSTNTTGITYTLDATSLAAGNTINSNTGTVTYSATWFGSSTITASAAGCSGPRNATHTVTTTASVGTPVFAIGAHSIRAQGAGVQSYSATATTNTGIIYTLDAASILAGNTVNSATGAVTYAATYSGTTTIRATASGCSGPAAATHTAITNADLVHTPLYLNNIFRWLDRIDPVASGSNTTLSTQTIQANDSVTFTMPQTTWTNITVKASPIQVYTYLNVSNNGNGTMSSNPNITATLKYGTGNIITLTSPYYSNGLLTFTGTWPSDVIVPAGASISLVITSHEGTDFKIQYGSATKPSRIDLPVSTYINIVALDVYNAAYPAGTIRNSTLPNSNNFIRATVTDPFGVSDITGVNMSIFPTATSGAATIVSALGGTAIFEFPWTSPAINTNFILSAVAKQGLENNVTYVRDRALNTCSVCPPVAVADSASGAGGSPVLIDVLANDYDPNNNINLASLTLLTQPTNGSTSIIGGKVVYLPNGTFTGVDQFTYGICDSTSLCDTATVKVTIDPTIVDACTDATASHIMYIPYPEQDARTALLASQNTGLTINNIRTVISIKCPYPNMTIVWDQWEDGYEVNPLNPVQSTTQVWGDGNPYNGIAPGYPDDIIPAGGSIVLDNTMPANPRVPANIFYDGKDKIYSSGQISVTQVCGEPGVIGLQCMKTDVASTKDFGRSFTVPCGQNFPSQDFAYTALFIRAAENNTTVHIDKDNDGTFETTFVLNEGQSYLVNGGVMTGATITSSAPIGVDLHIGGIDGYSSREVPLYPASWYSHTYYTPVPTTGNQQAMRDTNVVMLYNSLSRAITINYTSGIPSSGSILLPPKTAKRFAMSLSQTAAYKFTNPTGESFTAIQICDSYTPGGGGVVGAKYDWAFNLIAEERLTTFATTAWAPGSTDGTRNDNPVWVTSAGNTTIYVKYDGNLLTGGSISPSGLHYDVSYPLNALNHKRLKNPYKNDQSGLAVYTCDGTKLAAVYGEDASTAVPGNPSWDVGSTIRPFCALKLIFANDDYANTLTDNPVTIPILKNDYGFNAVVDPNTVTTLGLLQPKHGSVIINSNGTILYTPNTGYQGMDTLEYSVCSTPSPVVCDKATVFVRIASCPAPSNKNIIAGQVFIDTARDGINHGRIPYYPAKVFLYIDGNCNGTIDANELSDSITVDNSGTYQFITYPEKTISDNFENCASGSTGNTPWAGNWVDAGDPSVGFCVNPPQSIANTKAEIVKDGAFSKALRLQGSNVSATRTVNLNGATYAFLTFSYRRATSTLVAGRDIIVQASTNGVAFSTVFTISGTGALDSNYVTIYNQDISAYASAPTTYIRFRTNSNVQNGDSVFIDNVSIKYLKYPQCYITQLSAASVDSSYLITTPVQRTISISGSGSCISPYDFGVAKKIISVSGIVWDDANGNIIKDASEPVVNGTNTGAGVVTGTPLYVNLIDTTGLVMASAQVQSNGTYNFPNVPQSYTGLILELSTNKGVLNASMPSVQIPNNWVTIGENKNGQGGMPDATPNSIIVLNTGISNITSQNFGIERLPDSDPKSQNYGANIPLKLYTIPTLTGTDPEDGIAGSGNKFKIISLPAGAVLMYNGLNVMAGDIIVNYNPALLKIDPDDATFTTYFDYALIDAAGKEDPTPARVTVQWGAVLPIESMPLTGIAKTNSNLLSWSTESENNSDHFELENSKDGSNFSSIASISSRGNSNNKTFYSYLHHNPTGAYNFYRVKLIKRTGEIGQSNTVLMKLGSKQSDMIVMPNPFRTNFSVSVNFNQAGKAVLSIIDMHGKIVKTLECSVIAGTNTITVSNMGALPSGSYTVEIKIGKEVVHGKILKIQ